MDVPKRRAPLWMADKRWFVCISIDWYRKFRTSGFLEFGSAAGKSFCVRRTECKEILVKFYYIEMW